MPQTRISPAGMVARGALFTYLTPRLAKDAKVNINALVRGVTSRNYAKSIPAMDKAIKAAVKGKLAKDADISDLAELLNALKPNMTEADAIPMAPQGAPPAPAPAASPAPIGGPDGESEDIVSQIKMYLQQEGISPEILNNLDAFLAEAGAHGQPPKAPQANPAGPPGNGDQSPANQGSLNLGAGDEDMSDVLMPEGGEGLEPRGSEETNLEAEDEDCEADDEVIPSSQEEVDGKDEDDDEDDDDQGVDEVVPSEQEELLEQAHDSRPITRKAMDAAIKTAVKTAQDAAIKNQRAIRQAERFVRPWVGELAMDAANHPADIYRGALKALGVKGVEKVHPDALKPILEAQPLPSRAPRHVQIAADAKPEGSFFDRFPEAKGITLQ